MTYGVSTRRRKSVDLQQGIVGWDGLKRDVGMPSVTGKLALLDEEVNRGWGAFLLSYAADDADLVAELAAGFGDGVDMKSRGFGLPGNIVS